MSQEQETVRLDYLDIKKDVKALQPDWVNPPTVMDLKKDLTEASVSHRTHVALINDWLHALRADKKINTVEGRSKVQPKLIRKQNEWRYASLEEPFLSTDDMFQVTPATYMDVDAARQNAMILNKQFRVDINKVDFINRYIRTAVNMGTVVVKTSWETEVGEVVEEVPVYTQTHEELLAVLQQLVTAGQIDEQTAMQYVQAGQPIQIGVEPQVVTKEVINRPVLQVRDTRNIIIDPSCEGIVSKAQFIVDKFLSDLSTLKKDGRYFNLDKIDSRDFSSLQDYLYFDEWRDDPNFRFQDKPRQKLVVYEYWGYWDINNDGIVKPIVASWIGDVMIRLEENPYPDKKLPFVVVQYLPPDWHTVYGDSDASLIKENQDIIGAVMRSIIDLIGRSANAQQGVRKDLLDPINADRFRKGLDFEYNPVANVGDAMFTTKIPEIPRSALELIQIENNEAEAISGVRAFNNGINSNALGEMLDLETLVPLFNGNFVRVKDLKIGDELIGKNGKAVKVKTLFDIKYPETAYELIFSNGAKVICGGEHKWLIKSQNGKVKYRKDFSIADTDTLASMVNTNKKVYIPKITRIDMEGDYPDIDPYLIGIWLGDGNTNESSFVTADEEIADRFRKCFTLVPQSNPATGKATCYRIKSKNHELGLKEKEASERDPSRFKYWLQELGILGCKHIPKQYFSAPYKVKLELLKGLMDSDGTVDKRSGYSIFTQSEGLLLDDTIKLLKSMGLNPRIVKVKHPGRKSVIKTTGQIIEQKKPCYEIGFLCPDNPFFIKRKANLYKEPKQNSSYKVVSAKLVPKSFMRCLEVDSPDHLFAITEDFILTHNSVGGIKSALDASSKREMSILRRLSNGLIDIGRKVLAMNSVWLSDEEVIRITDDEFVAIKRSDLAGNFDLSLKVSTAEADNQKASELAFMLQTLGPSADLSLTKIIMAKIADLRKIPDLAKAITDYAPQPDPMQIEMQQLQIELLKAQVQNEYAKARENEVDVQLKSAKAQNELAKAGKTVSERDKLDLDFVEQATGLQQERMLEEQALGHQYKMEEARQAREQRNLNNNNQ